MFLTQIHSTDKDQVSPLYITRSCLVQTNTEPNHNTTQHNDQNLYFPCSLRRSPAAICAGK